MSTALSAHVKGNPHWSTLETPASPAASIHRKEKLRSADMRAIFKTLEPRVKKLKKIKKNLKENSQKIIHWFGLGQ